MRILATSHIVLLASGWGILKGFLRFANLYTEAAEAILAKTEGRAYTKAELGFPDATDGTRGVAADLGYEGMELGRKFPRIGSELVPKLSGYGLRLIGGWHSGFLSERSVDAEWDAAAGHVRLLEECGSPVLVYGECGMMTGGSPWDEPLSQGPELKSIDLTDYAAKLGEFAVRLQERGIKLADHYHLKMLVETAEEISALFDSTRQEVELLLDTGHAYAAGADYGEILRHFGSRVVHIHLKDVRREVLERARREDISFNSAVRAGLFTVPGDGDLDFTGIKNFIQSSGYHGWVVVEAEQDPAKAPPRQYAEKAYRYLRHLLFDQLART